MNLHFRTASAEDLDILNQISVQSKRHWNYPEEWIERWKADLTITETDLSEQTITVAVRHSTIIGFCAIQENPGYYDIMHLWVLPDFIGQGYGKQLLQYSIQSVCKESKPIHVESDPNAEAFYQKQGFVTFDQVESYPKGRFLPIMKLAPHNG